MKILLFGKNGQVGWELQRTLAPLGEIIALGRQELDLTDQQAIRNTVRRIKPELIVNAAAYTAVDKAEEEPDLALAVNATAPGILAEEASQPNARLVHYSTDYVFDVTKTEPYTEDDQPNPINIYGKSKLVGEEVIKETGCDHIILRISWVYSLRGRNFVLTILRLIAERDELSIVNDQHGAPTWCRQLTEATALLIAMGSFRHASTSGLYHLTAAGETSWHEFSEAILSQTGNDIKNRIPLKAIKTDDYPTPAIRLRNSVLDNSLIMQHYGIKLPHWRKQLELTMAKD